MNFFRRVSRNIPVAPFQVSPALPFSLMIFLVAAFLLMFAPGGTAISGVLGASEETGFPIASSEAGSLSVPAEEGFAEAGFVSTSAGSGAMTGETGLPGGLAQNGGCARTGGVMPIDVQVFLAGDGGNSGEPPVAGGTVDVVATLSWAGAGARPRVKEVPSLVPPGSVEVERVGVTARTIYSAGRPVWSQSFTYHLRLGGPGRVSIPSLVFRCEVNGTEETVTSPPLEFNVAPPSEPHVLAKVLRHPYFFGVLAILIFAATVFRAIRRRRELVEVGAMADEAAAGKLRDDLDVRLAGVTAAARKVTAGDEVGALRELSGVLEGTIESCRGIQSRGLDREELRERLCDCGLPGEMAALAAEIHEASVTLKYGGMCPERERILRLFSRAPALVRCLAGSGPAVTFACPSCGAVVGTDDICCPTCGEEFEQIRKESR